MSVKVTTPTKSNFADCSSAISTGISFHDKLDSIVNIAVERQVSTRNKDTSISPVKVTPGLKKGRRSGEKGPYQQNKKKNTKFEKQKEKIKLPTKFLLGGNINDPLNLNSLNDEEINKALNAITPVSSPLPTPSHRNQKVEVLIPPNINDPLNLNSGEDIDIGLISPRSSCKKRKKNKRKKSGSEQVNPNIKDNNLDEAQIDQDFSAPLTLQIDSNKFRKIADAIVSPAIPQDSPKPKRKRTVSESKSCDGKELDSVLRSSEKQKLKKQISNQNVQKPKFRPKDDRFIYGNYDRYYGKRNPKSEDDKRLLSFQKEWFDGKDVLDIGCNIGHITLSVAKKFNPKKITGMDIDPKLISIARKNVRHYLSEDTFKSKTFPVSMASTYGPVAAPAIPENDLSRFPDNVNFVQGNYVLDNDELLELQTEEFDAIMGLSLTKWIHLNFGDDGLKRAFKRMHKQLRPGGKLVLEPQSRSTYKKKKKLNETIWKNYQEIKLWPDTFRKYLLSSEVGFAKCEYVDIPVHRSKGFQRPIMVFTKAETTTTTPREVTESRGVTPLMNIDCGGHSATPRLEGSEFTPTQSFDLHPSFSFSSAHLPIRGYDAFLESQISRAFTPTQELIAVTGRVGTPRFDIGTPSVSARNTPNRHGHYSDNDGQWFSSQNSNDEELFEQLQDSEENDTEQLANEERSDMISSLAIKSSESNVTQTSQEQSKLTSSSETGKISSETKTSSLKEETISKELDLDGMQSDSEQSKSLETNNFGNRIVQKDKDTDVKIQSKSGEKSPDDVRSKQS